MATFTEQLMILASHCQVSIDRSGPLILGLFMVGLVGSASHCAGMCGPFVLAQVAARRGLPGGGLPGGAVEPGPPQLGLRRLTGLALLPYHLGRGTTYAVMAAILALPVGLLSALPNLAWIPAVLLAAAAALFLLQALRSWGLFGAEAVATPSLAILGPARALFQRPVGWRGYGLGAVLGLLPCGLLYAALAAAAAAGDPLGAAFAMLGFVAGTMPMLIAIGLLGHGAATHWRDLARRALPVISAMNAVVLLVMAWRLSGLSAGA